MTANNQYFERNMLINAQKTNAILEADNWGPKTELKNINRFLDISAANVVNQIAIHNTLTNLLQNNDGSLESINNLNAKLAYQNSRPVGVGSDDVWLPTELLIEIKAAIAHQTEVQQETGLAGMNDILKDISNNTGKVIPERIDDISKNTYFIHDRLMDISKNFEMISEDLSGNGWDNSKNLIEIKTEIVTGLGGGGQISIDLGAINSTLGVIDTGNLTAINNSAATTALNTGTTAAEVAGAGLNLTNINTNTLKLPEAMKTKISQRNGGGGENWVSLPAGVTSCEGQWGANELLNIFPPKKFVLFLEINQDLATGTAPDVEYLDLESSFDGATWFFQDRFVLEDFNPPVGIPPALPLTGGPHVTLSKTYDWMGEFMKVILGGPGGSSVVIMKCYARGI